jgi:hypothetical protein
MEAYNSNISFAYYHWVKLWFLDANLANDLLWEKIWLIINICSFVFNNMFVQHGSCFWFGRPFLHSERNGNS